jgi:hypothetical protein
MKSSLTNLPTPASYLLACAKYSPPTSSISYPLNPNGWILLVNNPITSLSL